MGARTTLTDAWPLFGLRLRTERLVLRLPTDGDLVRLLALAKAGIHEPGTMPFGVAWSTVPSPAFERGFMQHHWGVRGSWSPEQVDPQPDGRMGGRSDRLAVDRRDRVRDRPDDPHRVVARAAFQGRGFGKEMRAAVLGFGFDGLGARIATTEAFLDNAASNGVSRSLGYEPNGFGSLAPEGVARETQRFRMTAEAWRSRPRPALAIEGLEALPGDVRRLTWGSRPRRASRRLTVDGSCPTAPRRPCRARFVVCWSTRADPRDPRLEAAARAASAAAGSAATEPAAPARR